jgi:hypothetical protein
MAHWDKVQWVKFPNPHKGGKGKAGHFLFPEGSAFICQMGQFRQDGRRGDKLHIFNTPPKEFDQILSPLRRNGQIQEEVSVKRDERGRGNRTIHRSNPSLGSTSFGDGCPWPH